MSELVKPNQQESRAQRLDKFMSEIQFLVHALDTTLLLSPINILTTRTGTEKTRRIKRRSCKYFLDDQVIKHSIEKKPTRIYHYNGLTGRTYVDNGNGWEEVEPRESSVWNNIEDAIGVLLTSGGPF